MCGRYRLEEDWSDFPEFAIPTEFLPNLDIRPTDRAPIVRLTVEGRWSGEMRRWGFLRKWIGSRGTWVKRQLYNAVGEELGVKHSFKTAFRTSHCLVPMSAWYEWPVVNGKKFRVRIGLKKQRIFAVAGLFETSKHPDTDEPVETFTMITVPPNKTLGSAHDRAPLVLFPEDYQTWLEGGIRSEALIHGCPESDAFFIEPYVI